MKSIIINSLLLLSLSAVLFSCKKDFGNLNSPTVESFLGNAAQSDLNNLVSGTESGLRTSLAFYLDDVGTIGREGYHFSASEPRYVTDLLGADAATLSNSNFYINTPWANAYRVVKNCNLLIQAANNSTLITSDQKSGYYGFARTIKAYQLLLNLNLTDSNGIRLDVSDPDNLGPIVSYSEGLAGILALLDSAKADLSAGSVVFSLSSGFNGFNDAAGLIKFNRALAARVDAYLANWPDVLTALSESFFSLTADFNLGVNHVFGTGTGDQLNPMFFPQNQTGEVRVAHPSYATDIQPGDDRISKATLRQATASLSGLSSNRDVWVYTSSTAPVPIIRNEELILLYAEANIQNSNFPEGEKALNIIRNGHHLPNYSGPVTKDALIDEMLYERRYSLFFEGHRWIDMRRYNRLNELPLDRTGDDIWSEFPLPVSE
ncbi:MAG: RagB/SusD family nutrient uptake outer membrane protein [Bacteroidota bacterium]|nr:RagB/SusD family nutrient uptake outer membrane protein [Bacteroidota bacterium]MDP4212673.1 RagB/SusD family nutrient uptake outer membrane protein [Bacteroidota bacterium]MDP4250618.1 RagB/SusD family nutrient uptake outer membrane protein [Bacteroidota bacterium]